MGRIQVRPSRLQGTLRAPPSKSQTLRAILYGALGSGTSTIFCPLDSPDTESMIRAVQVLGASVRRSPDRIDIVGAGGVIQLQGDQIDAGNSGIVLRFCSALAALGSSPVRITGDESICKNRPMEDLLEGLRQLGVRVESTDQFAPVVVQGPIQPGRAVIEGSDSQPVSALIIAAAFAAGPVEIVVCHPGEKPWVDLTLHWLDRLGIPYERRGYGWYRIGGLKRGHQGFEYTVPGDFSSAAFPIVAALVTGSALSISNLDFSDSQGDKELFSVLQTMGAKIEVSSKGIHVSPSPDLSGIDIDVNNFIDAVPIISVLGCCAEGQTRVYNCAAARHKECDRIQCTASELRRMGAEVIEDNDGMVIKHSPLHGACVYSHNDHRLAMALVVAGLGADGMTTVGPFRCVAKTFPTFMRDFQAIGADLADCQNIILCGLPRSGKTSVGEELAKRLGRPFIDTDKAIERAYGHPCREIFIQEGEAYFRTLEWQQIVNISPTAGAVISLGGGFFASKEMEQLVRSLGTVIYLSVPIGEALERCLQHGPPVCAKDCGFEQLALARAPVYERVAHRVVEASGLTVSQIVDTLMS